MTVVVPVFPAPAGINRVGLDVDGTPFRVPRASGDKPTSTAPVTVTPWCSPRQRG
ncbi:hypothetical protein H1244_001148 [Salmonella enterica]|nr:hypothetical protein [Salmonella enterica]EGS7014088.1 hypothetical protein [Salmonella enterica]